MNEGKLMNTAQKTRRVIIAAVVANIIACAALQVSAAAEPCKPNALGMCMIPKKAVVAPGWTARMAGEFSGLREQLVLKAKEAGQLLKAPQLAIEFMEHCGLKKEWDAFFSDYRQMVSARKQQGIPYRKPVFFCSEES